MRGTISTILVMTGLVTSCHAADVSGGDPGAAVPLTMSVSEQGAPPLGPSLLEFVHFEGSTADLSAKTYIQSLDSDAWPRTFGNVTFGIDDPLLTGITGDPSLPPRIIVRSSLVRATSATEAVEKMRQFGSDLNVAGLGPVARALIFLVPVRADFESALAATKASAVPGLGQFAALAPQCAYARLRSDDSERQGAVLVVHVPDLALNLEDPSDRQCIEAFFARNLGLSEARVHGLIFPPDTTLQGACDVARILRPSQWNDAPRKATAGCPTAPPRRAATLIAYANAQGAGLTPAKAAKIIELTKQTCERQIRAGEIRDESCRSVALGGN